MREFKSNNSITYSCKYYVVWCPKYRRKVLVAGQEAALDEGLHRCHDLYNGALQERREAYRLGHRSLSYQDQQNELPAVKAEVPEYKTLHSQVLQDVLRRVDRAFQGFFRRVQAGQTPGYPRKTVTIRRDAAQWYVAVSCEVAVEPAPILLAETAVGIDLGLLHFAALSTAEEPVYTPNGAAAQAASRAVNSSLTSARPAGRLLLRTTGRSVVRA